MVGLTSYDDKLTFTRIKLSYSWLIHRQSGITHPELIYDDIMSRLIYRFFAHTTGRTLDERHIIHFGRLVLIAAKRVPALAMGIFDPDKYVTLLSPDLDNLIFGIFSISRFAMVRGRMHSLHPFFEILQTLTIKPKPFRIMRHHLT